MKTFGNSIIILSAALLLAGCSMEQRGTVIADGSRIAFCVKGSTKGSSITESNIAEAYGSDANIAVCATFEGKSYFRDGERLMVSSGLWSTANEYLWPEDQSAKIDFWSWAPMTMPQGCGSLEVQAPEESSVKFKYTLSQPSPEKQDAIHQKDILFGAETAVDRNTHNGEVVLKYRHPLSEIKIRVAKSNAGILKSISLENVCSSAEGIFEPDASPCFVWTPSDKKESYTQIFDEQISEEMGGDSTQDISSGTKGESYGTIFMMIPQDCAEVKLKATFRRLGATSDETFEADLNGTQWLAGESYTYTLNLLGGLGITVDFAVNGQSVEQLKMTNTGHEACFLRATVVGNIVDGDGNIINPWDARTATFTRAADWDTFWRYDDEECVYYYRQALAPGEQPERKLFDAFSAPQVPQGHTFNVSVIVQAIKTEEFKAE